MKAGAMENVKTTGLTASETYHDPPVRQWAEHLGTDSNG